MLSNQ